MKDPDDKQTQRSPTQKTKTGEKKRSKKQAVVVIHGIGEQLPMETLTGLVDTVWTKDGSVGPDTSFDPNTGEDRPKGKNYGSCLVG